MRILPLKLYDVTVRFAKFGSFEIFFFGLGSVTSKNFYELRSPLERECVCVCYLYWISGKVLDDL